MPSSPAKPTLGVLEWFRPDEYEQVERVLADLKSIGVKHLRTGVSWADWYTAKGEEWYAWLLPRLAQEVEVLPCFHYTPPSLGVVPKTSAPPRQPKDYADFIDLMITRFGKYFEWVELWNEPNNLIDWDWRLDPEWTIFCEMMSYAAHWAQHRGKKTVLAGMAPSDPNWLRLICDRGVLAYIDAVGIHGFPGTWEFDWQNWTTQVEQVQAVLEQYELKAQLWITETGFSTWSHDEHGQLRAFVKAIAAPVERVYWYSLYDLHPALSSQEGFHVDERHYHMGLKRQDGTEKLLFRLWHTGGLEAVRDIGELGIRREEQGSGGAGEQGGRGAEEQGSRKAGEQGSGGAEEQGSSNNFILHPSSFILASGNGFAEHPFFPTQDSGLRTQDSLSPVLITGGAGFIGTNLAHRLACKGQPVRILDNLSRPGVEQNLRWLQEMHGDLVQIEVADVRDRFAVRRAIQNAGMVFHFAAQVAVTTSLSNPIHDFEVNAKGTLNLLEEMRSLKNPPPLVFTSTNKVYGGLENVHLQLKGDRYEPEDDLIRHSGISEDRPLNFQSPYGCSKGAADQYVLDYAHTFGLPAVVFRMSCVYGSHQFGTEDQGWVAHFLIRALKDQPITLYGDGMQVRDILYVEDLLNAFELAQENIEAISGQAFNIGGGIENTTSLLELIEAIAKIQGKTPTVHFDNWRPKDQRYYVSDFSKFAAATGWTPQVGVRQGVEKLYQWLQQRSKGEMKYEVSSMKEVGR